MTFRVWIRWRWHCFRNGHTWDAFDDGSGRICGWCGRMETSE